MSEQTTACYNNNNNKVSKNVAFLYCIILLLLDYLCYEIGELYKVVLKLTLKTWTVFLINIRYMQPYNNR